MTRATFLAVAVVSAAILAYEVLLVRLYSIVSWHHFAYMVISVALLGFGASGTALAVARCRILPHFPAAFAACAALFAVTAVAGFGVAVRLPFNPLALVWDREQLVWLALGYLLLIPPFFFGGGAIGLAVSRFPERIDRLYAVDLLGAGIGALGVVGALFLLPPAAMLRLIAALGLVSAALGLAGTSSRGARVGAAGLAATAVLVAVWLPPSLTALVPHTSQYKGLKMALRVPGARVVEERSSPLGLVSVVESSTIPFRHAPGVSLASTVEPPPQLGVFTDGDSLSAITRFDGDLAPVRYLDFTTSALPYHMIDDPAVLILGAGAGAPVLLALYHEVPAIDAVELDPQVVDLVSHAYSDFAGGIYGRPEVDVWTGEARSFAARTEKRYDLIQIPLLYSFGAAVSGTQSLHESYTYTVEALRDYLDRLAPGGLLAITLWTKLPPRDTLKLFATAAAALEEIGLAPRDRLALLRSWKTATLLVAKEALQPDAIEVLKRFAADRSFDLAYYPGITAVEVNRFNVLERPYFYEAASALLGPQARAFVERYKFEIMPATDDRPFFHDFFKWRFLPELWSLRAQGTAAMLDMGYLIVFATVVQAVIVSLLLILVPLAVRRRRFGGAAPKARLSLYFLALGLAFLLVEIAFIQRFTLFLGHPLYAVAVVLAGFLVFAGIGSALSPGLERAIAARPGLARFGATGVVASGIAIGAGLYLALLPPVFDALIAFPDPAKIVIAVVLIAPLACLMGMPFPMGITRVAARSRELVPWAWGINGCASVVAAALATLLAIHLGFAAVVGIAAALYLTTPLTAPEPIPHPARGSG